jgi:glycopeptide antibiotics resistance protein
MKKTLIVSLIAASVIFLILTPILIQLMIYLHPVVLGVVLFCLVMAVFFIVLLIRRVTIQVPFAIFCMLMLFYSIALFILLFFRPSDQSYQSINLIPFSTIAFYLSGKVNGLISFYNLAANIGLFIPIGLFLKIRKSTRLQLFYLPLLIISMIEILQYVSHKGSMDIDDLILNVLGFYFGYLLHPLFKKVFIVSVQN